MGNPLSTVAVVNRRGWRTLGDRGAEKTLGAGIASNVVTIPAPADSPNTVTRRIAAERGDIVTHPAQGGQNVAQTDIGIEPASARQLGQIQKAEHPDPIVHRNDDDVARPQPAAVVEGLAAAPMT